MDNDFIQRAEKLTSFNISPCDVSSNQYKGEIRHLVNTHWFSDSSENVYQEKLDKLELNESIDYLKDEHNEGFKMLYSYNMKGIGPGEMMLYYLVDGAVLGGGNSAGVDLIIGDPSITINDDEYEVKAVKTVTNKVMDGKFVHDFKLGGTVNISDIMTRLRKLGNVSKNELPTSKINLLRGNPIFQEIERDYRDVAYEYFKKNKIIFIDNSPSRMGKIIDIGIIEKERIFIERMTSGTIKPLIKIE